jgi:sugar (pentulose or hexulose) kinase
MQKAEAYLVIDIGTGNVRVAVVKTDGEVIGVARDDLRYHSDELYPDSIYFEPEQLWEQLTRLAGEALKQAGDAPEHSGKVIIKALTSTSQREGIVLIGRDGKSLIGLPNIDHRGREWEHIIADKSRVYQLTGRYPTSLFSAMKLVGIREKRKEIWNEFAFFLSISDWVEYKLTALASYEHSQASETLLYDVAGKKWSDELCNVFNLSTNYLPELRDSGTVSGVILRTIAEDWNIAADAIVVKGGGDTQLAIKSTLPSVEDMVIVSGTTTPIVKLVDHYITDVEERTWTSRDIENGRFVFEANAGVTGLNYQRLKEVFYPNEGYDVIEKELSEIKSYNCMASLGSLIAVEKTPLVRGGFIFPAPVSHELTRGSFVWATLLDIAFSIAENYKILKEVAGHAPDYVWACGGGLQSRLLRQLIANIIGKNVQVRHGFEQSSAIGGALLCNEARQLNVSLLNTSVETVIPQEPERFQELYISWKHTRNCFRQSC